MHPFSPPTDVIAVVTANYHLYWRFLVKIKLIILAFVFVGFARAETISVQQFSYTGGAVSSMQTPVWEPESNGAMVPGFHLAFYGAPDPFAGCQLLQQDGTTATNWPWADVLQDTGLAETSGDLKWWPISGPNCAFANWQGYTHAHLNTQTTGGGFGLYTHTGPKPTDNSGSFWQPYPSTGDRNSTPDHPVNPYGQDTAGYFRLNWWDTQIMKPFSSPGPANWDLLRFAFISQQHVEKFEHPDSANQQVRQKMELNLLNPSCLGEKTPNNEDKKCQVQLLFYTAIAGIDAPELFIFADPAQGKIPSVSGRIPTAGVTQFYSGLPLYTSWFEPTQSTTWSSTKKFQVEISFNQFQNILKASTAKMDGVAISQAADCTKYFGSTCLDPNAWQLLEVGTHQEVYNSTFANSRAYVGGYVSELSVIALPLY
jgi:hypothetical protein